MRTFIDSLDQWACSIILYWRFAKVSMLLTVCLCCAQSYAAEIKDDKDLLKAGAKLFRQAKYGGALEQFNKAIKVDPKNPSLYLARGQSLHNLKKYDKAIADYTEAIRLKPDSANAYQLRGVTYDAISEYDKAIPDLERSIQLAPTHRFPYFLMVYVDNRRRNYKHGIAYLSKLIKLSPKDYEAYRYRGDFYSSIGKGKEALSDLNKAVSLHPKDGHMYQYRARCYYKLHEDKKALADNDKALELIPDDQAVLVDRGMIQAQMGRYDEALITFDKVIALNRWSHQAYNEKAIVLAQMGRTKEANEAFDKAVMYDSRHRNMYYGNHAKTSAETGNMDDVLGDVQAMRRTSSQPGRTVIDTKNLDAAIAGYSKLINLNTKVADHYYSRGVVLLCKNDSSAAALDFAKFLHLSGWRGDTVPCAVALNAVCLRKMKRENEANKLLDEASVKFRTDSWAKKLVDNLRGKSKPDDLLEASRDKNKLISANCFVGLWLASSNHPDAGTKYLQYVINNGERSLDEYSMAASAIETLKAQTRTSNKALTGK